MAGSGESQPSLSLAISTPGEQGHRVLAARAPPSRSIKRQEISAIDAS
jgi:hypothetical protein